MRLFASLSLVLLFPVLVWAAPMPWKTFSEQAKDFLTGGLGPCLDPSTGELVEAFFGLYTHGEDRYMTVYETKHNRLLVAYYPGKDSIYPTEVGLGQVDLDKVDRIPDITWEPYDPAKHTEPCSTLFPFPKA